MISLSAARANVRLHPTRYKSPPPMLNASRASSSSRPAREANKPVEPPKEPPQRPSIKSEYSASSITSFLSGPGNFASKAKSGVSFLNDNTRTYRSALANAGSYVATQTGLLPDRSVKATAEGNEKDKTWGEWARDWRDRRAQEGKAEETLNLLPGWVVVLPRKTSELDDSGVKPFDLKIATSGFANSLRSPENATRSQRVFMKIAKSFAALPQVSARIAQNMGGEMSVAPLSPSVVNQIVDKTLTDEPGQINAAGETKQSAEQTAEDTVRNNAMLSAPRPRRANTSTSIGSISTVNSVEASLLNMTTEQLKTFHENLDARLQPFWSSALQRRVQLSIYPVRIPTPLHTRHSVLTDEMPAQEPPLDEEPLMRNVFMTDAQGLFSQKIVIPWERIVSHGPSLGMAFNDPPHMSVRSGESKESTTWGLYLRAELLSDGGPNRLPPSATALQPTTSPSFTSGTLSDPPKPVELDADVWDPGANAFFSPNAIPMNKGCGGPGGGLLRLGKTDVVASTWTPIASTGGVRLISDLDDTVKVSNILSGAREVFRNAFCKPVEETQAEGMAELYRHLATQGVAGFHYVSNSPYELLPVLQKFFKHHDFPAGFSLKLKYYGGRNLMNGLFEPPGDRKRPGIVDVMESFPDAKFILVGDSGEQDLELYVAIAKQRKHQVLAIAIRDVTTPFTAGLSLSSAKANQTSGKTGTRTPLHRQSSSVSTSEIDMAALSDALGGVEGSGVEQAKESGIAGKTRVVARKIASKRSDLDLTSLRLTKRHPEESETPTSIRSRSRSSTLSNSNSNSNREDELVSGQQTPLPIEEAVSQAGAIDDATQSGTPTSDAAFVQQTQDEIQALTVAQLKLVKRTMEWTDRMKRARQEVPAEIKLLFFQHPEEVESEIAQIVRRTCGMDGEN